LRGLARTSGLHLSALDRRQGSAVHDAALPDLLGDADWAARAAADRGSRLQALLDQPPAAPEAPGDVLGSTLDVFRTVLDLRRSHGVEAIGLYIISMSRSASDALAVLALARVAGCAEDDIVPLDITPLFETVGDLEAAAGVMRSLFEDPVYREHLDRKSTRLNSSH